jgi:hypothetical protein
MLARYTNSSCQKINYLIMCKASRLKSPAQVEVSLKTANAPFNIKLDGRVGFSSTALIH